jgi:uncharacterized protein
MFRRTVSTKLEERLNEMRAFIQVVMGPRQTGKTTAVKQAVKATGLPVRVASADGVFELGAGWIEMQWRQARELTRNNVKAVLVLDEIQKIQQWPETVKALWDEDSWNDTPLLVILTGSSSLLLNSGLTESLAGRYELLRSTHWSLTEMSEAFNYTLEDYLKFGGYPGSARLKADEDRWREYMRDSIIEATISRDVLQMEDVRKPALMRALFELGAQYSAQELSYRKMLGQLDDRGNTDTLKHYLDLLDGAGMMSGIQKFDNKQIRSRASSPRLMVHDPALMTSMWRGQTSLLDDPTARGHLVETAVGAYLLNRAVIDNFEVYWWREGDKEVDFVLKRGEEITAIEVKSGRVSKSGMTDFLRLFPQAKPLIVGDINTSVEDFLRGKVL